MASLSNHQSLEYVKLLFIGDSGSGKTGALASLVKAGYNVAILDFDNGLDVLVHYLTEEERQRVHFKTLTDPMKGQGGSAVPSKKPSAFADAMKMMDHWKDEDEDLGKPSEWGSDWILVVDSLSFLSNAVLRDVLYVNGRSAAQPQIQDWGEAQRRIEGFLASIFSEDFKCNVIVNAHMQYQETQEGFVRVYPSTAGQKLAPKVGRYFNTTVLAKVKGSGGNAKRLIRTISEGSVELKTPAPMKIGEELDLSSGLAEIFSALKE